MQDEVKVTQADREAAANLYLALDGGSVDPSDIAYAETVRQGRCDDSAAVQAFARHRHQAERGEAWRPIETAPKDWTDVLVFSPEHEGFNCGGVFSAFYDTDDACWFTHGPGHNIRLHPTHWQPLPTPPEAGQ